MKTVFIGIDVGKSGGLCIAWDDGKFEALNFTTLDEYKDVLDGVNAHCSIEGVDVKAYIESVPFCIYGAKTSIANMAKLHRLAGQQEGVLMGLMIPYEEVSPRVWQKGLPNVDKLKGTQRKRKLKEIAVQRFPQLKPTLKTADAILICEYGKRKDS